ncbi:hypothetical protein SAMN04488041_102583 [Sulfitobacter pontiacus]|uniref:Uncharacterized protein n=1 Tax=Sulfitobacter pontiacus TaxID=60137 RepID=A0A1H2US57_9RHOB|nr:hypothetical protein [Sulfitobacter pontiacus]SDW58384.1 hypothetical protein SAMN04488041_102583 [Sulfitobacter pontiacus]
MIAPKGYVVVSNFQFEIFSRVSDQMSDDLRKRRSDLAHNFALMKTSAFLRDCPSLSVFFPDGRLFKITPDVCIYIQGHSTKRRLVSKFAFVNPSTGQIVPSIYKRHRRRMNGLLGRVLGERPTGDGPVYPNRFLRNLADKFQCLEGGYLTFEEQDGPKNQDELDAIISFPASRRETPQMEIDTNEIVLEIIKRAKSGEPVVRDEVKRELAADLNTESWRAVWKQATTAVPSLSKRGPKKRP